MKEQTVRTEEIMTEQEVAEYLKLSLPKLRKWRAVGAGPKFHKFDRSVRYKLSDVKRYLESTEQDTMAG